jgi:hypothetical protein
MNTVTPPYIIDGMIELFGHKGRERYYVKSIYFYCCKDIYEECIHDISMLYGDDYGNLYYFDISNVSYDDLVRRNYILYFKESNKKLLEIGPCTHCKLILLPIVK